MLDDVVLYETFKAAGHDSMLSRATQHVMVAMTCESDTTNPASHRNVCMRSSLHDCQMQSHQGVTLLMCNSRVSLKPSHLNGMVDD